LVSQAVAEAGLALDSDEAGLGTEPVAVAGEGLGIAADELLLAGRAKPVLLLTLEADLAVFRLVGLFWQFELLNLVLEFFDSEGLLVAEFALLTVLCLESVDFCLLGVNVSDVVIVFFLYVVKFLRHLVQLSFNALETLIVPVVFLLIEKLL
jgi:hypothetical protein